MKLESYHSSESKHQWKIVRTDSYEDVDVIRGGNPNGQGPPTIFDSY